MKSELLGAPAHGMRGALARLAPWRKPLSRVGLLLVGLITLALIGRSATAPAATPPSPVMSASSSLVPPPPPAPSTSASATPRSGSRATPEAPVFLNDATIEDLRRLPGIGPKRAEAVLALRAKIGRFHRVEDLLRVKGIGRATLKRLRPLVRLDAPPPPPAASAQSAAQ